MIAGLRTDLLDGVSVLVAAVPGPSGLGEMIGGLGAAVTGFAPTLDEAGEGGAEWVRATGRFAALLFDASGVAADLDELAGLRSVTDAAWIAVAAVVNGAFLPPHGTGGRIVLVAPPRDAGAYAPATAAALENLARTLSVEWARHAITSTAVVPSTGTEPAHLQSTVAFLLSPAGAYHSGSRLDLDLLAHS